MGSPCSVFWGLSTRHRPLLLRGLTDLPLMVCSQCMAAEPGDPTRRFVGLLLCTAPFSYLPGRCRVPCLELSCPSPRLSRILRSGRPGPTLCSGSGLQIESQGGCDAPQVLLPFLRGLSAVHPGVQGLKTSRLMCLTSFVNGLL